MLELVRKVNMSALLTLCACTVDADKVESNLDCAALISAASQKSMTGEPDFNSRTLTSSMMYLNAHAIPSGLREAEAFRQVKARRAELIETISSSAILVRAQACMERTPGP